MPTQSNFRPFSISGQYRDLLISFNVAKQNLGEVKIKTMLVKVGKEFLVVACWPIARPLCLLCLQKIFYSLLLVCFGMVSILLIASV